MIKVADLRGSLESSLSANKSFIAQDLPHALLDFFQTNIFSRLLHAKGFQTSENIQRQVQEKVSRLLSPWQGVNAKLALKAVEM